MKIDVQNGFLSFDDQSVRYDLRYVTAANFNEIFREWCRRLRTDATAAIRLPFNIDDEYVEAFEVEWAGSAIQLRTVRLDNIGYSPGVDPFMESLTMDLPVVERLPQPFLRRHKKELLEALEAWLEDRS